MQRRTICLLTAGALALLGVGTWWALAEPSDRAAREQLALVPRLRQPDGDENALFGLTRLHPVHLTLSADEYRAMQPSGGRRGGGPPGEPPAEQKKVLPDGREASVSNFGMTFPWAHADLEIAGERFADVGVRYKGNASYDASARGLKRSLKVDLQQFHDDNGKLHGEKKLNLHAAVMDSTKAREALSYRVFRSAGVPAPRTAFAEVSLTVPGEYERERLGLYVIVEQVDKSFLKAHFGDGGGLLMKPERVNGFNYLGESWSSYQARYQPEDPPTDAQAQRVIDFAKLVNRESDRAFREQIESYLDVDAFLRFIAVSGLLSNLDGYIANGHNYYIYLDPQTNRFAFLPWDMDLSLGGFPKGGSQHQQINLSVKKPYSDGNTLAQRVFAVAEYRARYDTILSELLADVFTRGRLIAYVEDIETVTLPQLELDAAAVSARREGERGGPSGVGPALRRFIVERLESVETQLAGERSGYEPAAHGPPRGAEDHGDRPERRRHRRPE